MSSVHQPPVGKPCSPVQKAVCLGIAIKMLTTTLVIMFITNSREKMANTATSYQSVGNIWEKDLLFDVTYDTTTVTGNEYSVPWSGSFTGFIEGCNCPRSDDYSNVQQGLSRGRCSFNQTHSDCVGVEPVPGKMLSVWTGGQQVNLVYRTGSKFLNIYKNMNTDGSCKSGFKRCGDINSVSKGICIPDHWPKCPVSRIVFNTTNPDPANSTATIPFKNYFLGVSYGIGSPLADLTIAEYAVCEGAANVAITPGRTEYPLNAKQVGACVPDLRYVRLDHLDQPTLFSLNNVDVSSRPSYGNLPSYFWFRFYKPLPEIKPSCLVEIPEIIGTSKRVQLLNDMTSSSLETFISVCCFAVLILTVGEIGFVGADAFESTFYTYYSNTKFFINVVNTLFLTYLLFQLRPDAQYFRTIADKQCFDALTNDYFERVASVIHGSVYGFVFWSVLISYFVIVLEIAYKFYDRWQKKQQEELVIYTDSTAREGTGPTSELVLDDGTQPTGRLSIMHEATEDYPALPEVQTT